jgi:hypothetical protein
MALEQGMSDIVRAFWEAAGGPEPYPRGLETSVLWALPLAIVKLPNLWIRTVQEWADQRNLLICLRCPDRPLRACLVANVGRGFVILDGIDSEDERRFSLAHEVAHFLLDYLMPRRRAVSHFGQQITEVLDGHRAPTLEERFSSILTDVPIGVHMHLMDRDDRGAYGRGQVALSEGRADRLALELLAPEAEVRVAAERGSCPASPDRIADVLRKDFGLPQSTSLTYATELSEQWHGVPSARDWLGLPGTKKPVELLDASRNSNQTPEQTGRGREDP